MKMPPKKRTIMKPIGGWKEQTYYIVSVSFNSFNPIHDYIFFSGFLHYDGQPGNYNTIVCFDDAVAIEDAHYLKVKQAIATRGKGGVIEQYPQVIQRRT